jgi:hypothetical protein
MYSGGEKQKERTAGRAERASTRFISTEARKDDAILERFFFNDTATTEIYTPNSRTPF